MRTIHSNIAWLLVCWGCLSLCVQPVSAKDFIVVIDAGHGGHDAGAVGRISKEKNINLNVALAVGKLIENSDKEIKVIYTREKDVFVTLQKRAQIANKNKANLFISIHTNALPKGRTIQGAETYTLGLHRTQENLEVAKQENSVILIEDDYQTRYAGFNPNSSESYIMFEFMQDKNMEQSVQLATLIQKQFKHTAHRIDRGVRQAGFLVLHATSMPSVLVELGYISTPEEERYLNSQEGIRNLSRSICQAILKYKSNQTGGGSEIRIAAVPNEPATDERPETPNTVSPQTKDAPSETTAPSKKASEGKPVFKVQILTSSTLLKKGDKKLKGFATVDYYKENGLYKYTYGESTDYNEILRLKKKANTAFKDAFIIAFRNGEKMDVREAIQEFKRNRIRK